MKKHPTKTAAKRKTTKKAEPARSAPARLENLLGELLEEGVRLDLGSVAAKTARLAARSQWLRLHRGTKALRFRPPEPKQFGTTQGITFSFLTAAGKSEYEWLNIRHPKVVLVNVNEAAKDRSKGQRAADDVHAPQYQLDRGPKFEWQRVFVNVFEKVPIA